MVRKFKTQIYPIILTGVLLKIHEILKMGYFEEKNLEPVSFNILFEDSDFIAIHKPSGILVHRTRISEDTVFVLQLLRDQLGYRIYPVHRLDRMTSGVLIFGKTKEAAGRLAELFRNQKTTKTYLAIVRGHLPETGTIDYALARSPKHEKQPAITEYKTLDQTEIPHAISRYPTSRYSLMEIYPKTGRFHQIRKHFAHLRHPVIGDRPHGDCKHNKYLREKLGISTMLLHAQSFSFVHPTTLNQVLITSEPDISFIKALNILEFKPLV